MYKMTVKFKHTAEELPENGEIVHGWFDGNLLRIKFCKGITKKERKAMENGEIENPFELLESFNNGKWDLHSTHRSKVYKHEDEDGNNKVAYGWDTNTSYQMLNGQDIKYWTRDFEYTI